MSRYRHRCSRGRGLPPQERRGIRQAACCLPSKPWVDRQLKIPRADSSDLVDAQPRASVATPGHSILCTCNVWSVGMARTVTTSSFLGMLSNVLDECSRMFTNIFMIHFAF